MEQTQSILESAARAKEGRRDTAPSVWTAESKSVWLNVWLMV